MTVDKLKRVMQRLRYDQRKLGNPDPRKVTRQDLERAIMIESGTCRATYYNNKRALVTLGWITTKTTQVFLTGKDLTEDY